jgi:hypothetical protein
MSVRRAVAVAVLLAVGLGGCGEDDAPPPPGSFAPLNYSYCRN